MPIRMKAWGIAVFTIIVTINSGSEAFSLAPGLPVYDVDGTCTRWFHTNKSQLNRCIEGEQGAYEHLKAIWSSMDARAIVACKAEIRSEQDMIYFYQKMDRCIPSANLRFAPPPAPETPEHFQP